MPNPIQLPKLNLPRTQKPTLIPKDPQWESSRTGLKEVWRSRDNKFQVFQDLVLLVDQNSSTGHESFVSNDPFTHVRQGASILSRNGVVVNVTPRDDRVEEIQRAQQAEDWYTNMLEVVDDWLMLTGRDPLLWQLAFFGLMRGWVAARPWMPTPDMSLPPFMWEPLDPWNVYPDFRGNGVARAWLDIPMSVGSARLLHPDYETNSPDTTMVTVSEYYDTSYYGVVIEGRVVTDLQPHGLPMCPILITPVGGLPYRGTPTDLRGYQEYIGLPFLFGMQPEVEQLNRVMSMAAEVVRKYIDPPIFYRTKTGETRPFDASPGAQNPGVIGEDVQFIIPPGAPPEVNALLTLLTQGIAKGGFPAIMFGEAPMSGTSGFLAANLQSAALAVIQNIATHLKHFVKVGNALMAWQFDQGNWSPDDLVGAIPMGSTWWAQTQQIMDYGHNVSIDPALPIDLAQNVIIFGQSVKAGLSPQWGMEHLLHIPNVQREIERSEAFAVSQDPAMVMLRAYKTFVKNGQTDEANIAQIRLQQLLAALMPQQGQMGQGQPGPAGQEMVSPSTGVPQEAMPGAMMGLPSGAPEGQGTNNAPYSQLSEQERQALAGRP
jgi:hypothetical protein